MFQYRSRYSYYDHRERDAQLVKLNSQLFVAQRQRNKALCIQLQKDIAKLH